MRVLFFEGDELILKDVDTVQAGHGQLLIESSSGDKRTHLKPHHTWTQEHLEALVRASASNAVIDLTSVRKAHRQVK